MESSVVDAVNAAIRFASFIEPEMQTDPSSFACLQLNKNICGNIWRPANHELSTEWKEWKDVISFLEKTNRKVVDLKRDDLIFTVFCPTMDSANRMKDETFGARLKHRINKLMATLGEMWREIQDFLGEDREILHVQGDRRMLQVTNKIPKSRNPPKGEDWFLTLENKVNELLKRLGKFHYKLTLITSQVIFHTTVLLYCNAFYFTFVFSNLNSTKD